MPAVFNNTTKGQNKILVLGQIAISETVGDRAKRTEIWTPPGGSIHFQVTILKFQILTFTRSHDPMAAILEK